MYETFANPVIKVSSATSGTISSSGRTFSLALGSGSKIVNPDGSITWQNVPVNGAIAGGGNGGGGAFAVDPVTFTVGAVSSVSFGSTTVLSAAAQTREPAAAPPATEGVSILTPVDELVPGGEIEISAAGFESNERNILVVLYSDPLVLDRQAGANGDGVVRWIGTLPDDIEPGEHTITMQGSISVGQVITVLSPGEAKSAQVEKSARAAASAAADAELREVAAGPSGGDGSTAWVVWAGAIALLIVAGGMTALVVAQRRRNSTE